MECEYWQKLVIPQQAPFYLTAIVLAFNDKWSQSYSTAQVQRHTRSHLHNYARQNNSLRSRYGICFNSESSPYD